MAKIYHMLKTGRHSRWVGDKKAGKREHYNAYDPNSNIIPDLTEDEIKSLGDRIQAVPAEQVEKKSAQSTATMTVLPASTPEPTVEKDSVQAPTVPIIVTGTADNPAGVLSISNHSELLSKSVPEIESELRSVNSASVLDEIQREETAGKQRVGVLKVIKARREELG